MSAAGARVQLQTWSRHFSRRPPRANPSPPNPSLTSPRSSAGAKGTVVRRDESAGEGTQYLAHEELQPLAPAQEGEDFLSDVLRRLSASDDWSLQFGAIDDARRIARFAPRVLASSGQIRKLVGSIASLVESLRSSLAKNALRCMGELFATLGKRLDQYLDAFLPVVLKRGADTNVFISDEAEATLREVCQHASEAKVLTPALAAASNRHPKIRVQALSCLAMLAQRLRGKVPTARHSVQAIVEATGKALVDANGDVRQLARVIATVLSTEAVLQELPSSAKLSASALPGIDPLNFDVFDVDSVLQYTELTRTQALSPLRVRSPKTMPIPVRVRSPSP
ncbi:unnamed protein product [Prorocentrum cordatum]|uniref:TOG domain-containing protein n=1 Tax=Prorocentrum cordatum TaxID=2364126 RepID=A0ABN9S1I7_9DINO|nr:unnamed protein product [Polarella glacialis]